jgi:hypothetical protein
VAAVTLCSNPFVIIMNPDSRPTDREKTNNDHDTLKYSLLGPSLTKSGQDNVDQTKVWMG